MRLAPAAPIAAALSTTILLAASPARADPPAPTTPPNEYAGEKSAAKFLLVAGAGAFGTGYLAAAGGGIVGLAIGSSQDSKYGASCGGGSSGYAFIPVVGPLLTLQHYPNHQVATYGSGPRLLDCNGSKTALTVMAVADSVVQIGGLAMALSGLVMHAVIAGKEGQSGSIALTAGAQEAPMGITLLGAF